MGQGTARGAPRGRQSHVTVPIEDWSPYEPLGIVARSGPPSAHPSREPNKRWWRRMLPLLLSNKPRFYGSLAASFLALVAAILIPRVTMEAIDNALIDRTTSLAPYIWALVGLALLPVDPHLRVPHVALRHRLSPRVRPAGHRLRAPHAHVVLVLRPRAIRSAHLTGELRHPLRAAVPDVRSPRRPEPRELRDRRHLHVHDPRRPHTRRALDDPVRLRGSA